MQKVDIRLSKKFKKPFISADVKLRDICSQLTQYLYNKSLTTGVNGCLGRPGQIHKKQIRGKEFYIHVPQEVWDNANEKFTRTTWSGWGGRTVHVNTMRDYLNNVIRHAQQNQVTVKLIFT
jgi:hypothetical protein